MWQRRALSSNPPVMIRRRWRVRSGAQFLASIEPYSRSKKAMINKSLTIGNEHLNPNGRSPGLAARASHAFAL
jgi:hypothetical protein